LTLFCWTFPFAGKWISNSIAFPVPAADSPTLNFGDGPIEISVICRKIGFFVADGVAS
jgi:hypothetical protein